MKRKLIATLRGLSAVVLMLFATNFLPVVAAYADTNQQTDTLTTNSVVSTQTISAKALTDHECNADEWHFVINQVDTAAHAPSTITVNFANGHTVTVSLAKVTKGGVAHYVTTTNLDSTVTSATATIYAGWSGQFNLSHGPCAETNQPVTAGVVTYTDDCGTAGDTYTVPSTAHVIYKDASNAVVTAGSHPGSGTVTITAYADTGYVLTAPYSFTHTFSTTSCENEDIPVTAGVVTFVDLCGTDNDTYTVPATAHVTYMIGQQTVAAGTHDGSGTVTVTAHADQGYVLTAPYTFSHTFKDKACKQHVKVFVCKYVGTPGVNERLKKGKNPISVSVKSTGGTAVGSSFNDKQGRSFVLGVDDGIFNPTREDCPAPQGPTEVTPAVQFTEPTCETPTGRVTVTAMTGVTYKVNGTVVTGTTSFPAGSSVTVTTELATGFVLANGVQDSFPHTFAAAPTDCVLGAVTGGRGGDVLGATTTQLANTGQSPWAAIIVGVTVISLTLTSAFASRRVRLDA